MSNLTQTKKVAREVSLDPIPGHTLVVYKRSGDRGKSFFIELNPEQQFTEERKGWWRRFTSDPPSYIAYAVNRNESLKLIISRLLLTSQGRAFDLIITVEYHVEAPRRVADRYDDDPLALLEEDIFDSLKDVLANSEWDDIKYRFAAVAEEALIGSRGKIDRRAANLGFAIESVKMERQLQQKDLRELEAEELREHMRVEQEKQRIEHEAAIQRANLEHVREVKKLEQQGYLQEKTLEQQASRIEIKRKLDNYERTKRLHDGIVDHSITGIGRAAEEINSFRQIEDGYRTFKRMAQETGAGDGGGGAGSGSQGGEGLRYGFLMEGAGDSGSLPKVIDLLTRTLRAVEEVGLTPADKNHLLSALLHIAAESMLGTDCDDAQIERYESRLQDVATELSHYPPELERFIRDNYRSLKERLK